MSGIGRWCLYSCPRHTRHLPNGPSPHPGAGAASPRRVKGPLTEVALRLFVQLGETLFIVLGLI